MKNIYTTSLVFLLITWASVKGYGQKFTYSLKTTSEVYKDLESPQKISNTTILETYDVKIPFEYEILGKKIDFNGGNGITVYRDCYLVDYNYRGYVLEPFYALLTKKNKTSSISYQIVGKSPDRILKFQWKNMAMIGHDTGDFVNIQLWLHETTNLMSVHIGPQKVTSTAGYNTYNQHGTGPEIGILRYDPNSNSFPEGQELVGDPKKPTMVYDVFRQLNGTPAPNTLYTFKPEGIVSVPSVAADINATLSSNPVNAELIIELDADRAQQTKIELYDPTGNVLIVPTEIQGNSIVANTKELSSGLYLCVVRQGTRSQVIKFIKQ